MFKITPTHLFQKLEREFTVMCEGPNEDSIVGTVMLLNHLREWICPGGEKSYKGKRVEDMSPAERLHSQLWEKPEYHVVKDLCNGAKHCVDRDNLASRTDVLVGFRAGLGRAGDSLGVRHFIVDDREIRDICAPVYAAYAAYFAALTLAPVQNNMT